MLCGVPSYSAPGLPRPTISQSTGAPPPRLRQAAHGRALLGVGVRGAGVAAVGGLALAALALGALLALADDLGLRLDLVVVLELEPAAG